MLPFFLIKKEELKKSYSASPVLLGELCPSSNHGVFLHQNLPKDLAGSWPTTNLDN